MSSPLERHRRWPRWLLNFMLLFSFFFLMYVLDSRPIEQVLPAALGFFFFLFLWFALYLHDRRTGR